MSEITFSPKQSFNAAYDKIAELLYGTARGIFVGSLVVLPILIIPLEFAPFSYSKALLVIAAMCLATIFYGLATLRQGVFSIPLPPALLAFWGVLLAIAVSAVLSGSHLKSFIGANLATQSVAFVAILAGIMTLSLVLLQNKRLVMRLYTLLFAAAALLGVYQILRVAFGPEFLSFGLTTSSVFSPVGSWNDMGVFFGAIIILTLIVLEQLPLPPLGRYLFAAVAGISTIILVVVQFTAVWILVGFTALTVLMYALMRQRVSKTETSSSSYVSILVSSVVTILALLMVVGSNVTSNVITAVTDISYLEVRPSISATTDIARNVYAENFFLGSGPNTFSDAWRQYKDPSINATIFWATDFTAGSGYLTTMFTTTGMLGTIAWLVFLLLFLYMGYRMLVKAERNDQFWYFIATSSFVAAMYLWFISIIYVPGSTILLLTALCTGIAMVAYAALCPVTTLSFDSTASRQGTLVLIGGVLMLLLLSVIILFSFASHYAAMYTFNSASGPLAAGDIAASNERIVQAYQLSQNDLFLRQLTLNNIARMNTLLTVENPTEEQQELFQQAIVQAVTAGREAVVIDRLDARNWTVLAATYSVLVGAEIPEAAPRGREAVEEAKRLDPVNPELFLIAAQIESRSGNFETARSYIERALQLKPDYVPAIAFSTELDIAEGDIEQARRSVQSIIRIEPNNPGRHYQLAILYLAEENQTAAIQSLERAIELDPNFSNARYVLALQLAELERRNEALDQLAVVLNLNPDNQDVQNLISQIESGESFTAPTSTNLVDELPPTVQDDTVQADSVPDTNLLTPVNPSGTGQTPERGQPETPALSAPEEALFEPLDESGETE